jgi:hypothetical protein
LYENGHPFNNSFSKFLIKKIKNFDENKQYFEIEKNFKIKLTNDIRIYFYYWHIFKIVYLIINELIYNNKKVIF